MLQKIKALIAAQNAAKKATANEMALRTELFDIFLADGKAKKKGSSTFRMDGYKIEATGVINTTIYEAGLEAVRTGLIEAFGEQIGNAYYDAAFPPKLTYSVTGHKKVPEEMRELVNDALISKPGSPTIKFTLEETDGN